MPISSLIAIALTVSLSAPVNIQDQSIEQLVQTGNAALNDRRSSEAETAWREVLKRDPKNGIAYLKLGDSLRIGRQFEAAQEAYKKAIELTPKQIDGYLALADLLQYTKVDEAERVYRQAIVNARPNAKVYAGLAQVLNYDPFGTRVFSAAEIAERTLYWQKAIELDPKNPEYYVRLGIILEQQGQVDKAIGLYKSGMKMNFLWAYTQYGEVLEKQNKLAEILPIYQKAIEDNPKARNLIGLYGMLGRTAAKVGKLKDAEAAFYEVLQLDPSDIYAYFSLGDVLKKQGKTEEALSFYQKAAEIVRPDSLADPGSSFSYSQTGDMLRDRGLFDLAIATYRKAIKLNPNNYAPYAWIGETLKMQGKLDEASVYIRKSILLKPIEKKG